MADVLEQARTAVARHQLALFDAGRINVVVVPPEDVRWLLTALRDRERETVQQTAKAVCTWCEDGRAVHQVSTGAFWSHTVDGPTGQMERTCEFTDGWDRWPAYVPKAEAP